MTETQTSDRDLSHITSLAVLKQEIAATRARINSKEPQVAALLVRLPEETVKKAVSTLISLFLAKKIAFQTAKAINTALKLILNNRQENKEHHNKGKFFSSITQLGVFSAIKVLFNKLQNKKATEVV